ncbi:MAG: hypothetical protein JO149_05930 [Gammaproteobacteria bacterium]|nr:hypothetical protein [Gammaproteobacteria bacterium]
MQQRTINGMANFINFLLPIEDSFIKQIIALATKTQTNILNELQSKYGNELKEGHKAHFLDIYKNRHSCKVKIAKKLQLSCESPLYSLKDVSTFINTFIKYRHKHMTEIDPKLGRLGKIFEKYINEVNDLNNKFDTINTCINHIHEAMIMIFRYMKAMIQIDNPNEINTIHTSLNLAQKYYVEQIITFKEIVINNYQRARQIITQSKNEDPNKYADDANKYAKDQVTRFFSELNSLMMTLSNHAKKSFLDEQMQAYLTRITYEETHSPHQNAFRLVLQEFVGNLKLDEKNFLWQCYQSLNDMHFRLTPKETDKKKYWCLSTLLEKNIALLQTSTSKKFSLLQDKEDTQEDEDIRKAMASVGMVYKPKDKPRPQTVEQNEEKVIFVDFTDPLHTQNLIRNLYDVLFVTPNMTTSAINDLLDKALAKHFKNHLDHIHFDNALYGILNDWRNHLTMWLHQVKNELHRAEQLLVTNNSVSTKSNDEMDIPREIVSITPSPVTEVSQVIENASNTPKRYSL